MGASESPTEAQACVQCPMSPWGSLPLCPPELGVAQGWPFLCSINQTDQMLAHLQSFSSVPEHFTLPDSTKSGVPQYSATSFSRSGQCLPCGLSPTAFCFPPYGPSIQIGCGLLNIPIPSFA